MREEHKEFTAFVSTRGQFEFNRMPFGLSNSQATYQRAVDQAAPRMPKRSSIRGRYMCALEGFRCSFGPFGPNVR